MFDLTWLNEAELQFIVIADTHYLRSTTPGASEFPSRRKQSARSKVALEQAAQIPADFMMHLGDVAQEYAGSDNFGSALDEALALIRDAGLKPYHAAGNQDVGDKSDPTVPAEEATEASMAMFEQRVGPTWYSFDVKGWHISVVNTQVLNSTTLKAREEQRAWLEQDLAAATGRKIVMLHLPLYLHDPDESDFGHYDNLGQPDRQWLLDLIEKHQIELTMSGHVHWRFYNRYNNARIMTMASPAFTRPGFAHTFTSEAPSEQGRNDEPKLGFFLVRVCDGHLHIHTMRTEGRTEQPTELTTGWRNIVTRTSAGLERSPVSVVVRGEPTPVADVPRAWPSVQRQTVHNDYPLLGCYEMGARQVQIDWRYTLDPVQRAQLHKIKHDGIGIRAELLWGDPAARKWTPDRDLIDAVEIRLIGRELSADVVDAVRRLTGRGIAVAVSPVVPRWTVPGKQHPRTRIGWVAEELAAVGSQLNEADAPPVRLPVAVTMSDIAGNLIDFQAAALRDEDRLDLLITFDSDNDALLAWRTAEAMFGGACIHESRLFFDPLLDMDRTMDKTSGLLNTMSNPRPAFHVLRCLNTILFSQPAAEPWRWIATTSDQWFAIESNERALVLCRGADKVDSPPPQILTRLNKGRAVSVCRLITGVTRQTGTWAQTPPHISGLHEPIAIIVD